jgi:hypothetical protein
MEDAARALAQRRGLVMAPGGLVRDPSGAMVARGWKRFAESALAAGELLQEGDAYVMAEVYAKVKQTPVVSVKVTATGPVVLVEQEQLAEQGPVALPKLLQDPVLQERSWTPYLSKAPWRSRSTRGGAGPG